VKDFEVQVRRILKIDPDISCIKGKVLEERGDIQFFLFHKDQRYLPATYSGGEVTIDINSETPLSVATGRYDESQVIPHPLPIKEWYRRSGEVLDAFGEGVNRKFWNDAYRSYADKVMKFLK
jgi:hypothetical protein